MDNLDEFLKPVTRPDVRGLRDTLRTNTSRVVRRRRWRVYARRVLVLAACYAAGLATYWSLQATTPVPQPTAMAQALPETLQHDTQPTKRVAIRVEPPELIERQAALAKGNRCVELYHRAGDGYLARGEEISALRCYRHSLDSGRADDLVIQPEHDTWLLMSLKAARQKESTDARN